MSWRREALLHLGARVGSALASTAVFALLARQHSGAEGQRLLFLVFVGGFAVAFLRSFGALLAGLQGAQRRTQRWARARAMAQRFVWTSPLLVAALAGLLLVQGLSLPLALVGAVLLLLAGFDADQLRAARGRSPLFSVGYSLGCVLALAVLLLVPPSPAQGLAAVAAPWLVVAAVQLPALAVLRRRSPRRARAGFGGWSALASALVLALFDGVVLNLPFLMGAQMPAATGYDLALAARLFSSAQPFFPLVLHWLATGRLHRVGQRLGLGEGRVLLALLVGSGLAASVAFVLLFGWLGRQAITGHQYALFALLLLAYALFATVSRRSGDAVPARWRVGGSAAVLLAFAAAAAVLAQVGWPSAAAVVALQASALVALAGLLHRRARRSA